MTLCSTPRLINGAVRSCGESVSSDGSTSAVASAPSSSAPLITRLQKSLNFSPPNAEKRLSTRYRHRPARL
jgi:hypothetical protein